SRNDDSPRDRDRPRGDARVARRGRPGVRRDPRTRAGPGGRKRLSLRARGQARSLPSLRPAGGAAGERRAALPAPALRGRAAQAGRHRPQRDAAAGDGRGRPGPGLHFDTGYAGGPERRHRDRDQAQAGGGGGMANRRHWREASQGVRPGVAGGRAPGGTSLMVGRRLACAVLAALCATSCAARKSEPEVVGVEHQTHVSGSAPAVTPLEPGAAAAPAAAAADPGATATATAASTAVDPEPTLRVVLVEKASAGDGLRLVAQLSREPSAVRSMELHGPRRCVVDVDGPAIASRQQQVVATQDPVAPRLRVGSYPDHLRLVLDVESGASAPCEARLAGSAVVIGIGAPPVGTEPEIVWLASALPDGSRAHASEVMARALGGSASADVTSASSAGPAAQPAPPTDPPASQAAASPPPPEPPAEKKHQIASAPPAPPLGTALAPDVPPGAPVRKYTGRRISLEFKDADILNVLRIIADVANKNIVATDDVKGRVTIVLRDVPWDQALDILLKSTGLEQVEFDDVITVSTAKRLEEERKARLAARQAGQQLEPLRTEYIRVNYVKAGDLANILQGGAGTSGAAAVAAQEIANQAPIGDAAGQRRGLLSGRGSVQVNEATNTLIVRDIADGLANARELVRRLDVQTPQVAIQGLIFEADVNSDRSLGILWGAVYNASPETGNPTGKNFPGRVSVGGAGPTTNTNADGVVSPILVDFPAPGVIPGSGSTLGLLLGSLSGSAQIDAQLTALETAGKGKVISRPKVVTLNNTEATIQSLEILRVRLPSSGTV